MTVTPPTLTNVRVDVADNVAFLRINRPEKRNALDRATRSALIEGIDWAGGTDTVRVVVISGEGGEAFASGADLSEASPVTALGVRAMLEERRVYDAIGDCPRPVVAMIDGLCLGGGCELALAADVRVASSRSLFGQPEIRLGLIPGGGGTQRLPRLVGSGHAMRLILTGQLLDADEARLLGLVDLVVAPEDLQSATSELCGTMARHSPIALKLAKQAVRAAFELPLRDGLVLERDLLCLAMTSEDAAEGIAAFREERPPHFTGR